MGVPIGTFIGAHLGWRATFVFVAVSGAVATVVCAASLPRRWDADGSPNSLGFRFLFNASVARTLLVTLVAFTGEFCAYPYIGVLLGRSWIGEPSRLAVLLLGFGAAGVLGNWMAGIGSDRFGPGKVLVAALAGLALTLAGLEIAVTWPLAAALAVLVWGAAAWSITVPQQRRLHGLMPRASALGMAANQSMLYLGMATGSVVGGVAIGELGAGAGAMAGSVAVMIALAIALLSRRNTRPRRGGSRPAQPWRT